MPSHYFPISTNRLAVLLTECWSTIKILTECIISIIRISYTCVYYVNGIGYRTYHPPSPVFFLICLVCLRFAFRKKIVFGLLLCNCIPIAVQHALRIDGSSLSDLEKSTALSWLIFDIILSGVEFSNIDKIQAVTACHNHYIARKWQAFLMY